MNFGSKHSWLDGLNENQPAALLSRRRNILFSRFTLCAFFVDLAHTIHDTTLGLYGAAFADALIGAFIFVAYLINERGHHVLSKTMLLVFVNTSLTVYCSLVPKHNGVYLFYFPLIGMSSVIFDAEHRVRGLFFVTLSSSLFLTLVATDFHLLGILSIPSAPEGNSFLFNLITSLAVLILCIRFIMKYNDESENRLIRLATEIQQKNLRLEKTNAELDRFVYSASHDLRAPLLSIQGVVNIATLEDNPVAVREYLGMIHHQATKLDHFIKDIICFSRNARTEVAVKRIDIHELVNGVIDGLKFMQGAERIRMETEIDEGEWHGDKGRLSTIVSNLLCNAVQFRNTSAPESWIKISVRKNCRYGCITVRDNGLGIPKEHQQRIFDMFYRAHDHSTGSGLGLYVVKETVEKLNGKIQMISHPGKGTTFTVTLPFEAA